MNYPRLLFVLALIIFLTEAALGQNGCRNNNTFSSNLNTTLSSLSSKVDDNGFYNVSVGEGIDIVNAMVLCTGDLQLKSCRDCAAEAAAELLKPCPYPTHSIYWVDDRRCMVRYSNATMYGVVDTSLIVYIKILQNVTSPELFKEDLRTLLDNLTRKAASGGPLRKVAAASIPGPDFQTIYGMVQCTPDLSLEDCSDCLYDAARDIPGGCGGNSGCRIQFPSCDIKFQTNRFFNETRLQELETVPGPAPPPQPLTQPLLQPSPGKKNGNTTRTIISIVVPVVVCLIVAISAIILLRKRKKAESMENSEPIEEISTVESLQYAFSTIKTATNNFSDDNKLGQGGFGAVYKGKLPNGQEIAVKRLSMNSGQGDLEFKNEVLLLVKLQHRNLVRLLGFALEGMEKLLVYEFVQNASLDFFIFGRTNHSCLDWDIRYKIIVGIAKGILYLHEDSRLKIIHRDLKASNILLDKDMNPKIADFGMARLFRQDETQGNTSRIVGTYGYMPPEYIIHGQFSIKSDVFSFGVLVLETISGQRNNNFRSGENVEDLLSFTWKNWREGTAGNVVDPLLMSGSGGSGSIREMLRCIHIGLLCVQENATDRPTMASVVLMLSSSSITLAVPSQPAFYFPSGYGSGFSRHQGHNSRDHVHNSSAGQDGQSDHSSQNDATISELYPR